MRRTARAIATLAAAAAVSGTAGAATAEAGQATMTLQTSGGYAVVTKTWVPHGGTYRVTYRGRVTDYGGDGRHMRLYRHTRGPAGLLGVRYVGAGRTARFSGGPIYADHVSFQACVYDRGRRVQCGGVW
jgi:hypothetical protein